MPMSSLLPAMAGAWQRALLILPSPYGRVLSSAAAAEGRTKALAGEQPSSQQMPQQTRQEIAAIFAWVKQFGTFIMELLVSASYQVDKLTAEYAWKGWKFKIQHIFLSLRLSVSQKIWLWGHNHLPEDREQMSVQPPSTEVPNLAKWSIPFPICCIPKHSWGGIAAGGAKHRPCFRPGRFPPLFISMTWTLWSSCFPSLLTCNSPLCGTAHSREEWVLISYTQRNGLQVLCSAKGFGKGHTCGTWV